VPLEELVVELPPGAAVRWVSVTLDQAELDSRVAQDGEEVVLTLPPGTVLGTGGLLSVELRWDPDAGAEAM
jgi:hypothetical protein